MSTHSYVYKLFSLQKIGAFLSWYESNYTLNVREEIASSSRSNNNDNLWFVCVYSSEKLFVKVWLLIKIDLGRQTIRLGVKLILFERLDPSALAALILEEEEELEQG